MTEMIINFIFMMLGGAMGVIVATLAHGPKKDEENESPYDSPRVIACNKLKRHQLSVAILRDRCVDDPDGTIARVKKEFANEIVRIIEDEIEVEDDRRSNHCKFYLDIWTKEAADDKADSSI